MLCNALDQHLQVLVQLLHQLLQLPRGTVQVQGLGRWRLRCCQRQRLGAHGAQVEAGLQGWARADELILEIEMFSW